MSSRLQLDVCNLSLGWRHLVNAYEVKASIGVIAGNTVIHAWAPWVWGTTQSTLYKYTYFFTFYQVRLVNFGGYDVKGHTRHREI